MTCSTCYHVNPSGATRCYHCGAQLVAEPQQYIWGRASDDDESTTHDATWGATSGGDPAGRTSSDSYARPLSPDMIYQADGSIALGTPHPPRRRSAAGGLAARLFAPLGSGLLLLSKLNFLFLFAKFGKVGLTAISMLVSVVAYASLWGLGWAAAFGFVILLFIHEMGHWTMMRLKGVPASAPIFIPFLGAVIGMRAMPRSVKDEAEIGIAGPIAGTAAALACVGLGALYGGHLWPLLGAIGLFLNLFNLLPVSPLDGGRIVAAVSRWLWIVGLVGLVLLFVWAHNPFVLLIGLIGGLETIARFRGRYAPTSRPGYYDLRTRDRVTMGTLYFGLIAVIAVALLASPVAIGA